MSGLGFLWLLNRSERADAWNVLPADMPVIAVAAVMTPFALALYAVLSAHDIRRFDEDPLRVVDFER